MKKSQHGITLIALVITIIVMLILVGVTVSIALNGGLIGKTLDAAQQTKKAQQEDELKMLYAASVMDQYAQSGNSDSNTQTGNSAIDDHLPSGYSGENGTYFAPDGDVYKVENGSLVKDNNYSPTGYVRNITSQQDIINAITDSNNDTKFWNSEVWNIQNDITITQTISVNCYRAIELTINGNGHTITGSDDTSGNFAKQMFKFNAYDNGDTTIKINDLNIVSGYHFRHALEFHKNAAGVNQYVRLNNVTIDHSKGTSQNDKYGAAIICNSSEIKIQNNFSIISGPRAWAAIDLDNSNGDVTLIFTEHANISFTDNRSSAKKDSEPFIGFSRESNSNAITFTNYSSYGMDHVTKESSQKEGYDLK